MRRCALFAAGVFTGWLTAYYGAWLAAYRYLTKGTR